MKKLTFLIAILILSQSKQAPGENQPRNNQYSMGKRNTKRFNNRFSALNLDHRRKKPLTPQSPFSRAHQNQWNQQFGKRHHSHFSRGNGLRTVQNQNPGVQKKTARPHGFMGVPTIGFMDFGRRSEKLKELLERMEKAKKKGQQATINPGRAYPTRKTLFDRKKRPKSPRTVGAHNNHPNSPTTPQREQDPHKRGRKDLFNPRNFPETHSREKRSRLVKQNLFDRFGAKRDEAHAKFLKNFNTCLYSCKQFIYGMKKDKDNSKVVVGEGGKHRPPQNCVNLPEDGGDQVSGCMNSLMSHLEKMTVKARNFVKERLKHHDQALDALGKTITAFRSDARNRCSQMVLAGTGGCTQALNDIVAEILNKADFRDCWYTEYLRIVDVMELEFQRSEKLEAIQTKCGQGSQ